MARHLTPDERAAVVARYVETANASQVAREFGLSESGVRKILAAADGARKGDLHARAVARAIRKARRSLARKVDAIDLYLLSHADGDAGSIALEPKDFAAVVNAQCNVTSKLLEVEGRIEASKQARLTRELRRAEIELARLRIAAGGVEKHEHAVTVDLTAARADLAAVLAGSAGASDPSGEDGSGSPSR